MDQRRILGLTNFCMAGLFGLVASLSFGAFVLGILAILAGEPLVWPVVFALAVALAAAIVGGVLAVLHVRCGVDAIHGRRRRMQSILALVYFPLCVLGLVWSIPAIWQGEFWLALLYVVLFSFVGAYAIHAQRKH